MRVCIPGRLITMLIALLAITESCGSVMAADLFQEALDASNSGQLERAIELWTKVIDRRPKSYAAHANRGTAYMWTGHVFKGIVDWHAARELSPLFAYAVYEGRFIPETSRDSDMLNFPLSIELDPDYYPSVYMAGSLLLDLGRKDQTVTLFRKSIDLTRNPMLKTNFEYWIEMIESKSPE